MTPTIVTLSEAIEKLKTENNVPFTTLMKHGSMSVEYFAPLKIDTQTPHRQDELYIIARGHGNFICNNEIYPCKAGDVLFVPAGDEHHFENFSDDFATWVVFYGPDGGERQ